VSKSILRIYGKFVLNILPKDRLLSFSSPPPGEITERNRL
jgi:hypothetical protein